MPVTKPSAKQEAKPRTARLTTVKPSTARLHAAKIQLARPHGAKSTAKPFVAKHLNAKRCTKEQMIAAIQAAERKLGRAPSSNELRRLSGITACQVARRFGTYRAGVCAAGLKPNQHGVRVEAATLLEDWGKVARRIGRAPSNSEYERAGGYSRACFTRSFQSWMEVPAWFPGLWLPAGSRATGRTC
jgi:hypothetical protein